MWSYPIVYDVIVVGAGHAGCEAANIATKMGGQVLLLSSNLDNIAKASCNPAIGGIGKGHIVKEIDSLGGIMGRITDNSGIQFRMLNRTKGPAVRAPRAQIDKAIYQTTMKYYLEQVPNLSLIQGTVVGLKESLQKIEGVFTKEKIFYSGKTVILCTGTFLKGLMHIGKLKIPGGRLGDAPTNDLSLSLKNLGFSLGRLKTGTPARIDARSINFSSLEEQKGEEGVYFSHYDKNFSPLLEQKSCWITYTNEKTTRIVKDNLHLSALYGGEIQGKGPRYCPSIEDKVVKFSDKDRHQIFIEPEGLNTTEMYINGISTSLPMEIQLPMIHSIKGLEDAHITRPGYAIEYDYVTSGFILPSMETKLIENLFFCGQINGTTGYEEAAAQGLIAGINAMQKIHHKPSFVPSRYESYIGIMLDDLTIRPIDEPYRMFTSRAENRLSLRQDNALYRLGESAYKLGLITNTEYLKIQQRIRIINEEVHRLSKTFLQKNSHGYTLTQLLSRPEYSYDKLKAEFPNEIKDYEDEIKNQIEITVKYEGYIERQKKTLESFLKADSINIPKTINYKTIKGLSLEAIEKFEKFSPVTLGSALRLPGIATADIQVLMIALKKHACL